MNARYPTDPLNQATQVVLPEGPRPLIRQIPVGPQYPVHALGPLQQVVLTVQAVTQAPVGICAQSALAAVALAVQGHADVVSLSGIVPTSLFCFTIAESGERKSTCDKIFMAPIREYEREQNAVYRSAVNQWKTDLKRWRAKQDKLMKEIAGKNTANALEAEADLVSLGSEPARPLSPKLTAAEPTIEGLFKQFLIGQPSLGLFSDEAGSFLGGFSMSADNKLKTVAGLSSLWGGEPIDRVRASDDPETLYGRRLSAHLMAQPVVATPLLSDPVAGGQGFLARMLITQPQSAIGTRLLQETKTNQTEGISIFNFNLRAALNRPVPTYDDSPQELCPRILSLSDGAEDLLTQWYLKTEREQAPGGPWERVRSFASKSPEQAARISGVLTLYSDLDAQQVNAETMSHAITLAEFYLNEARRLIDVSVMTSHYDHADKLRVWILDSWPVVAQKQNRSSQFITPRDLMGFGPRAFRDNPKITKLLAILEHHGWLKRLPADTNVDGSFRKVSFQIVRS